MTARDAIHHRIADRDDDVDDDQPGNACRNDEDTVGRFVRQSSTSPRPVGRGRPRSGPSGWRLVRRPRQPEPSMNDVARGAEQHGCASDRLSIRGPSRVIWRGVTVVDHTVPELG